jgi:hypothetical protein
VIVIHVCANISDGEAQSHLDRTISKAPVRTLGVARNRPLGKCLQTKGLSENRNLGIVSVQRRYHVGALVGKDKQGVP